MRLGGAARSVWTGRGAAATELERRRVIKEQQGNAAGTLVWAAAGDREEQRPGSGPA